MKKVIWVDIDDVLSETVHSLVKYFNEVHWFDINYENFQNYRVYEQEYFKNKNISKMQMHDMWNDFFDSEYWYNLKKVNWSLESIQELKKRWYDMHLITARWQELEENTLNWIKKEFQGIEFQGIHFVWSYSWKWMKKSEICNKYWIKIMVDDNHENCIDLHEYWVETYLITRPWNKDYNEQEHHPYVKRVNTWSEIIKQIQ